MVFRWPDCEASGWRARAQSGTLGVLLLVAVVLVLVGTVGLYLFSDLSGEEEPVVVSIDSAVDADTIHISHDGGDTLDPEAVSVVLESANQSVQAAPGGSAAVASGRFSAGDVWSIDARGRLTGARTARVVVVHEPTNTVLHERTHSVEGDGPTPTTLSALVIAGQGGDATVGSGTNASVSVTVTNDGATATRADVTVAVGSRVTRTETTAELSPGADERVTVENVTGTLPADTYSVTIATVTDEVTGSLTVESGGPTAGGALAYGTAAQTVTSHNTSNWNQTAVLDDADGDVLALAWSPDGTRLAFGAVDGRVYVLDRSDWSRVATLTGATDAVSAVAWSPDGSQLAYGSHDGTVTVHKTASWTAERTLSGPGASVWDVAFSPDGTALAVGTTTGVAIHETAGWTRTARLTQSGFTDSLAWSPGGASLAAGNGTGGVTVHETTGWTVERGFDLASDMVRSLSWAPDRQLLAAGTADGSVSILDTATWTPTVQRSAGTDIWSVDWSADGGTLAAGSADGRAVIYDTADWSESVVLGDGLPVRAVAFVGEEIE